MYDKDGSALATAHSYGRSNEQGLYIYDRFSKPSARFVAYLRVLFEGRGITASAVLPSKHPHNR